MRPAAFLLLALVAGCVTPDAATTTTPGPTTTPETPGTAPAPPAEVAPPIGERLPVEPERFVMLENHTLARIVPGDPEVPAASVRETLSPLAFYQATTDAPPLDPWTSGPIRVPFESVSDGEVVLSFTSDANAVSTIPKSVFPPIGGWFGTTDRYAFFILAHDAPDTLEAGKSYTVRMPLKSPNGGFFVRADEQLALHIFSAYQPADGSTISWLVGGPDPAGVVLPHAHFNISAPTATVLVDETGETGPNPGLEGSANPQPADIPFDVPPDAVYVVLEVTGAPKGGGRIDIDLSARTGAGDVIQSGSSPFATETVVLGPGNLAAYGRSLVAHVTSSASATGGTFQLKVTAYGP